jgi:hypothetical protein
LEKAVNNYNNLTAIFKEAKMRPERDNGLGDLIDHRLDHYFYEIKRCCNKYRLTEAMVKTLKPEYVSHPRY